MNSATKLKAEALSIAQKAQDEDRPLSKDETEKLESLVEQIRVTNEVEKLQGGFAPAGNGSLFEAAKAAGWEKGKKVYVDRGLLKTASFDGDVDSLSPIRREGEGLAFDRRYLADVFPSTGIANEVSSVQVLRQVSRVLPNPADTQRTFLETSQKAEVASVRELVDASVGILAVVESDVPNRLLIQDGLRSMIDSDLRLAILEAKDDAIMDAINAAGPASTGTYAAGAQDFIEAVRYGIADMQDEGINPTVLALNPLKAAEFDLTRTEGPENQFIFGPGAAARPPFGLLVIASKSVTYASPLLIEPAGALHRYEGALALDTFEQDAGQTNQSTIRLEQSFLAHVERVAHIRFLRQGS